MRRLISNLVALTIVVAALGQCPTKDVTSSRSEFCISDFVDVSISPNSDISSITWTVNNNSESGNSSYSYSPSNTGAQNIEATVTLTNGETCTYTPSETIHINALPTAEFSVSKTKLCKLDQVILFTDETTNSVNRTWIIQNATYENTDTVLSVEFNQPGFKDITLVVEDAKGCRHSKTIDSAIAAYESIDLDFASSSEDKCVPVKTNITSEMKLGLQTIGSVLWRTPGASVDSSTSLNLSNVEYDQIGNYTTTLTVNTDQGCIYSKRINSFIRVGDTTSLAISIDKTVACIGEPVTLKELTPKRQGGLTWKTSALTQRLIDRNSVELVFADTGYVDLSLKNNHKGCISDLDSNNLLYIKGIKADFYSSNNFHCDTGHVVNVTNNTDSFSGSMSSYHWSVFDKNQTLVFEDSSYSLSYQPKVFPSAYDVQLIAKNANGCIDSTRKEKFIKLDTYQFEFNSDPGVGCVGQVFKIHNLTVSPSFYGNDLYSWTFLDKNGSTELSTSNDIIPTMSYADTGYYPIKIKAINPIGCEAEEILYDKVRVAQPDVSFIQEDQQFCLTDSIYFASTTTPFVYASRHKFTLVHAISGNEWKYNGDSVLVKPTELGEYDVYYAHSIGTSCLDSAIGKVWVNGVKGDIQVANKNGCINHEVQPTFNVSYNEHHGYSGDDLDYFWEVVPSAGVTIVGEGTSHPRIKFNDKGSYKIKVYVSNSSGCWSHISSDLISIGVEADFKFSDNGICLGESFDVVNTSRNKPDSIAWIFPPQTTNVTSTSSDQKTVTISEAGEYDISIIASKSYGCSDTMTKSVSIINVVANFSSEDTLLTCAPSQALFINHSQNADSLEYNVGYEKFTIPNTDSFLYNFSQNSGPLGFDIQLVAKNNYGCTDTFVLNKRIKLLGPIASFIASENVACDSLSVSFTNTSTEYQTSYFNYGDGSFVDTNSIQTHKYVQSTLPRQIVYPSIKIVDNGGCEAEYSLPDGITLNASPLVNINLIPGDTLCRREKLLFSETEKNGNSYLWSFNGDSISSGKSGSNYMLAEGSQVLTLKVANEDGCYTEEVKNIYVHSTPDLSFDVPEYFCKNAVLTFGIVPSSETDIIGYNWDFDEIGNHKNQQHTSANEASIKYASSGLKTIKASAQLLNGCSIPDSISLNVFDTDLIPSLQLNSVSFNDQNELEINYPEFHFEYLKELDLFKNGDLITSISDTSSRRFVDDSYDIDLKSFYSASIKAQCGSNGPESIVHSPVVLTASSPKVNQVDLDWSYYVGFDQLEKYEIFRKDKNSNLQYLGETYNTTSAYSDQSALCNHIYIYYVVAVNSDGRKSLSNRFEIVPTYELNLNKTRLSLASVLDDEAIELNWSNSGYVNHDYYEVLKYNADSSQIMEIIEVNSEKLFDFNVDPKNTSYYYSVTDVDHCGNRTPSENYLNTINLRGDYINDMPVLEWNAIDKGGFEWQGVMIEYLGLENEVIGVASIDSSIYVDQEGRDDVNGYLRYRVCAINTNGDTSFSNTVAITGTGKYFIPNAFTPNGDGLNDEFVISALFMKNEVTENDFQLEIFTRWGEKIFESNSMTENWDGTYRGQPAQIGTYLYTIKFTSNNRIKHYDKGSVKLLR